MSEVYYTVQWSRPNAPAGKSPLTSWMDTGTYGTFAEAEACIAGWEKEMTDLGGHDGFSVHRIVRRTDEVVTALDLHTEDVLHLTRPASTCVHGRYCQVNGCR